MRAKFLLLLLAFTAMGGALLFGQGIFTPEPRTAEAANIVVNSLAKGEALQGRAIARFRANGVNTRSLPEPILRELSRITTLVLERQREASPEFARVLDSQRAFSEDYATWKRLGYLPRDF